MRKTQEKGITLIALIITIIIMIILAAVAISIVINGGLFDQASNAAIATDVAYVKEQIQADLVAKISELGEAITEADIENILEIYATYEGNITILDNVITFPSKLYTNKGNEFVLEEMKTWGSAGIEAKIEAIITEGGYIEIQYMIPMKDLLKLAGNELGASVNTMEDLFVVIVSDWEGIDFSSYDEYLQYLASSDGYSNVEEMIEDWYGDEKNTQEVKEEIMLESISDFLTGELEINKLVQYRDGEIFNGWPIFYTSYILNSQGLYGSAYNYVSWAAVYHFRFLFDVGVESNSVILDHNIPF